MSSFLCFICHNTVNSDTNEETRDKYREIVGMNLCPDSQLCYICCHMVNKLWLFKSICLKRSLEYPVLFSEKGTINLQYNELETIIICTEENCLTTSLSQLFVDNRDHSINSNDYTKLEESRDDFDDYFRDKTVKDAVEIEIERIEEFGKSDGQFLKSDEQFVNNDGEIVNSDEQFVNSDEPFVNSNEHFVNSDEHFVNSDEHFVNSDEQFVNSEEQFVNNDDSIHNDDIHHSDDGNTFDYESKKDQESGMESKEQSGEENQINYEFYEEERNVCLNEIRNEGNDEATEDLETSKKQKSKKSKKDFEKIILSIEEQKAELEAQRKSKKYLEAEFKCYNCALGFLFKDTYQAHMMRHEESNGEHVCTLCSLRFASSAVLRCHAALHGVRYRCSLCSELVRARQTHRHAACCRQLPPKNTCHECGAVFQHSSGLQQHLKRFHMSKTSSRTYSCSVCGKSYNNQAAVRTHMIKHIHRKFSCDQCTSIFSSPYTLSQHKKKHTVSEQSSQHYCNTCGVGYTSRKSLLAHHRQSASHQQRAYDCPICNRSCPNERSLTSHISTVHSATKPFQCATCDARYSSRKSLTRHERGHIAPPQIKLAVCHLCGRSFKGKSKLNRHLREVCEKDKLEEELSSYYEQQHIL